MIQRHLRRNCINVMNVTGLMPQFLGCVAIFAQSIEAEYIDFFRAGILNILPVNNEWLSEHQPEM